MKKFILAALVAACALGAFSSVAGAATIEVRNLAGAELPNIETQGRITFEAPTFGVRIVCNKTMLGRLNARATGTLALGGNNAGEINEVRLANCTGGRAVATLITLASSVRLSWIRVVERREAELGGREARFLIETGGNECLYNADMVGRSTAEARGLFTTITLRLLRINSVTRLRGIFCPGEGSVTISGTLTITRPAVGVGVSLR